MQNRDTPKFKTELTDYSVLPEDKSWPYVDNIQVDALIVGAGFGKLASALKRQQQTFSIACMKF